MSKFFEGQELERIVFDEDSVIQVGEGKVEKIVVTMENGQMAAVPWFQVHYSDGRVQKWNAALIEGVTL